MASVQQIVEAFIEEHKGFVPEGAQLYLPDRDQTFTVSGVRFFKQKDRKHPTVVLDWKSNCTVCGAEYDFETRRKFKYPPRTCTGCRGRAPAVAYERAPRPPKQPKERRPKIGRGERAVLEAVAALGFVYDRCPEMVVAREAAKRLPAPQPGSRDQRVNNSRRAMANLRRRGLLPAAIHEGEVVFI